MNLILLSGNSIKNKDWIEKIKQLFVRDFDSVFIQYYKHWKTQEEFIDFDYELSVLEKNTKTSNNYVVFAKSAGAVLTLIALKQNKIKPKKIIFLGLPVEWAKEQGRDLGHLVHNLEIPFLFIQNSEDPYCSYQSLSKFLKDKTIKNYKTFEFKNNTHDYENYEKIKEIVLNFIKK
jgi:hypothetical protein